MARKRLRRATSNRRAKLIGGATSSARDKRRYGVKVERTPSSSTSKKLQLRETDYSRCFPASRCIRIRNKPKAKGAGAKGVGGERRSSKGREKSGKFLSNEDELTNLRDRTAWNRDVEKRGKEKGKRGPRIDP